MIESPENNGAPFGTESEPQSQSPTPSKPVRSTRAAQRGADSAEGESAEGAADASAGDTSQTRPSRDIHTYQVIHRVGPHPSNPAWTFYASHELDAQGAIDFIKTHQF